MKRLVLTRWRTLLFCLVLSLSAIIAAQQHSNGLDVPPVLSPPEAVAAIIQLAALKPGNVLVDLGCGDGRIVIAAASARARAVCVENVPEILELARRRAQAAGLAGQIDFQLKDLREYVKDSSALASVDVVVLYLTSDLNRQIAGDLERNLRVGARVISHAYGVADWKPKEIRAVRIQATGNTTRVYLYQMRAQGR